MRPHFKSTRSPGRLSRLLVLLIALAIPAAAGAFTLQVVTPDGTPISSGYRWLVEEDNTTLTIPHTVQVDPPSISMDIHNSHAPVVARGRTGVTGTLDVGVPLGTRYFVSVLPDSGYAMSGTTVAANQSAVTVTVNPLPLPTAQISILAFVDHNPINAAKDEHEDGMGGATVVISDAAGQLMQDAFGNMLGTTYQRNPAGEFILGPDGQPLVDQVGTGIIRTLTQADFNAALAGDTSRNPYNLKVGEVLVKNLVPGKYGVQVIPPGFDDVGNPVQWVQTSTIEGTKTVDAWVQADEARLFVEGFGTGFNHAFFGFIKTAPTYPSTIFGQTVNVLPWNISDPSHPDYTDRSGFTGTLEGTVRVNHFSRPPALQGFFPGPVVEQCWVGLNDPVALAEGETVPLVEPPGEELNFFRSTFYSAQCDPDGHFLIENVPPGVYQLVTWDTPLDLLIGYHTVTVAPGPSGTGEATPLGDILNFRWFGTLEGTVFLDTNQNGFRDPGEPGIAEQNINIRFRDGTIYQAQPTDVFGGYALEEVFPFFKWLVPEVDFARFKATGMTAAVDYGGEVLDPWPGNGNKNPQPQANGSLWRTETGPVLTQAMHLFLTQTNLIDWGKTTYGPGENGGISGIVYYAVTRAEDDPRYAAAEEWEPGIPRVQVTLYRDANSDGVIDDLNGDGGPTLADVDNHPLGNFPGVEDVDNGTIGVFDFGDAIQITTTDSWDDNKPTGCIQNLPVVHGQTIPECADSFGTWNQIRPGLFDGGYAFDSYFPGGMASGSAEVDGLPTGTYIVGTSPPPGYELVKEEDKNVDFGDTYTPSLLVLPPVCVGDLRTVPDFLSFDGVTEAPFAGLAKPLCDRKQIFLTEGKNAATDFFFFTDVPKAARAVGFVNNDLAAEFNQGSPIYGEKSAVPWIPIAFRDWRGTELVRIYTDEFGHYNALLPSTFTVNVASPTGVSPNMLTAVLNDPILPDGSIDPFYNPLYSVTPWTFDYMPGKTTYLDTPLVPLAAFSAADVALDTEPATGTPRIYSLSGPVGTPLLCTDTDPVQNTITLTSVASLTGDGLTPVPNPAFDPTLPDSPFTIARDFGFGPPTGTVTLNGVPLNIDSWTNTTIVATVPSGAVTGQVLVTRGDTGVTSEVGVTLTIADCTLTSTHIVNPNGTGDFTTIQAAVDAASHGDLILVAPGTYRENVIMNKPVLLQGSGAGSTFIFANPSPPSRLQAWHDRIEPPVAQGGLNGMALQNYMLKFPFSENEAPGILVTGEMRFPTGVIRNFGPDPNANFFNPGNSFTVGDQVITNAAGGLEFVPGTERIPSRIDGFTIRGATGGGGIFVFAGARGLVITNNEITNNQGNYAGGISLGTPDAGFQIFDEGDFRKHTSDFQNLDIVVAGNKVHKNSGFQGAGGISVAEGAHGYLLEDNIVSGNFGRFNGGGIAHTGVSDLGVIRNNRILFNETFFNAPFLRAGDGGGIFIGGDAVAGGTGSGTITIEGNLIQGNLADGGYGGGIRAFGVNGRDILSISQPDQIDPIPDPWPVYRLNIFDNIIVNNVAGISGGGISLQDVARATIINNTVANNDSTATAAVAFPAGSFNSTPQPAGITSGVHSVQLQNYFTLAAANPAVPEFYQTPDPGYSQPVLKNNIIWHNRSFFNDSTLNGGAGGLAPNPAGLYWDLAVTGTAGALNPDYSLLTSLTGPNGENYNDGTNLAADPGFVLSYSNELLSGTVSDEGGNYISILLSPLDSTAGNYHLAAGSPAIERGGSIDTAAFPELLDDFDGDSRPQPVCGKVDIGADEFPPDAWAALTLLTPNGGETVPAGDLFQVGWGSPPWGIAGVTYDLSYRLRPGTAWTTIATGLTGNCYGWSVPPSIRNETTAQLRIFARSGGAILASDISDAPFTIDVVALTSHNNGTAVTSGATSTITWTTEYSPAPVQYVALFYRIGTGALRRITTIPYIQGTTLNSFDWLVPTVTTATSGVRVVLVFADGAGRTLLTDTSNAPFTINPTAPAALAPPAAATLSAATKAAPATTSATAVSTGTVAPATSAETVSTTRPVSVVVPNGDETLRTGEVIPVLWLSPASSTEVAGVKIELSLDGGKGWQAQAELTTDTEYLEWTVPVVKTAAEACMIRVSRLDGGGNIIDSDQSDRPFAIVPANQ